MKAPQHFNRPAPAQSDAWPMLGGSTAAPAAPPPHAQQSSASSAAQSVSNERTDKDTYTEIDDLDKRFDVKPIPPKVVNNLTKKESDSNSSSTVPELSHPHHRHCGGLAARPANVCRARTSARSRTSAT